MNLILYAIFSLFSLFILYLGITRKITIYMFFSGLLFCVIGALIIGEGITITYAGSYGFVNITNNSETGIATLDVSYNDLYTAFFGLAHVLLGIFGFMIPVFFVSNQEDKGDI